MKRWAIRLLLGLVSALAVVVVLAWLTVRASLPQLDGEIESAGIAAAVSIARDAAGIPTITASNRLDLAYATGFVHGQDRYFQMDLFRREAAGELSEIIGPATINSDRGKRLHRFRSRAIQALTALSALELDVLEHYAAGVNAGVDSGLTPGDVLTIHRVIDQVTDPVTGEVLGIETVELGYATVANVQQRYATAQFASQTLPYVGDVVKLSGGSGRQVSTIN